jgi:hypothetical protein
VTAAFRKEGGGIVGWATMLEEQNGDALRKGIRVLSHALMEKEVALTAVMLRDSERANETLDHSLFVRRNCGTMSPSVRLC